MREKCELARKGKEKEPPLLKVKPTPQVVQYCRPESSGIPLLSIGKPEVVQYFRLESSRSLSVNNTENEKIQSLLLPDGLFAVRRSIQSFSDFSVVWSYLL